MSSQWRVRPVNAADETGWRRLWRAYCDFYAITVEQSVTGELWRRIMDGQSPVNAVAAETVADAGGQSKLIGFGNYVLHPYTWGTEPICYLEDLFVEDRARGAGVGTALIEALLQMARDNGWPRVYWHTHELNHTARSLYEKFTPADPFVRYVVRLR